MSTEQIISGTIIYADDFEVIEGYLCIKDEKITEIGTDTAVDADMSGLIAPCFVNAHIHVGDSIFKDPPITDLDRLVKPPFGLKHQMLRWASVKDLQDAICGTLEDMIATGTCTFCDFREGGLEGTSILTDILSGFEGLTSLVLSRAEEPDNPKPGEIDRLLEVSSGIGMSGVNDASIGIIEECVKAAHSAGKMFAIHGGEKDTSDISAAIGLGPDFIVHMTHASESDIKHLSEVDIPVVICPRSNFITGVGAPNRPPIKMMLDAGLTVAVGTDNVMLNSVNMFSEMEVLSKVYGLDDRQVFKMCTLNGAKILGLDQELGSILEGKKPKLMVLDDDSPNLSNSSNLISSLVRRGRPDDIVAIIK
ncbi:MAG: amidohydrolase family protein [Methanosarcinales archaeon]|nr:amidohydrolase family protein [Methanosarcinales archaeon]